MAEAGSVACVCTLCFLHVTSFSPPRDAVETEAPCYVPELRFELRVLDSTVLTISPLSAAQLLEGDRWRVRITISHREAPARFSALCLSSD